MNRQCELLGIPEIQNLETGMDFRKPEYRREVFMRLYEFHLKYGTHPGLVYMLMPYLAERFQWTKEQKYWFAFINGCTQNPCTSWVIFNKFPNYSDDLEDDLERWHRANWKRLDYDTDRKCQKGHFVEMYLDYKANLGTLTQQQFFEDGLAFTDDPYENFRVVWDYVKNNFFMYGRLSTFSYLEYLKIMGLNIDCEQLFLNDMEGSKSHRNGLCKVFGRDDLDWHKDNANFRGYTKEIIEWLTKEGEILLNEAKERFKGESYINDVNYFTLESTLCNFKSWFRVNRRYPNVYTDMLFQRIKKAETLGWEDHGIDFDIFWEARKECLPDYLRVEDNCSDPTFVYNKLMKEKQNIFRETGQVVMMDFEWDCFKNDFNDKYYKL